MRFMIIRRADAQTEAGALPSDELLAAMGAYLESQVKALLVGEGLRPSSAGTRVRLKGKKFTVTDGPFTESKELIAGILVIEAKSLEDALEVVGRWPEEEGDVELEVRRAYGPDTPTEGAEPPPPARKPGTTRYMLLIRSDARTESGAPPDAKVVAAMGALMGEAAASGMALGGVGLKPSAEGAVVKRRRGRKTVLDGPFAESKELVAGYGLLQCATKEEAIAFAKRWLEIHVDWSGLGESEIEIRPLYEPADFFA
jgi:hypothetical protein